MLSEDNAMLWLAAILDVGIERRLELLRKFNSALEILELGADGLIKAGVRSNVAYKLFANEPLQVVTKILSDMYKTDMSFISYNSDKYPERLRNIYSSPIGLFTVGKNIDISERRVVGMVGTRHCTSYGATNTYSMAKSLAQRGAVVVSGMAAGIDSMAHKGALDAQGDTIAVFGCGADVCYPSSNRGLMERIKEDGMIVSEFPPGTVASNWTFPARNRIISGLSDVIAVMEGDERSGTMITVRHAIEQGKDVLAMPGNITSKYSRGTNKIIKEGAGVITCADDICFALNLPENTKKEKNLKKRDISLAPEEKLVYDCIHSEPISVDEIVLQINKPARDVQYALTMLELKGIVTKLSGQKYILGI